MQESGVPEERGGGLFVVLLVDRDVDITSTKVDGCAESGFTGQECLFRVHGRIHGSGGYDSQFTDQER